MGNKADMKKQGISGASETQTPLPTSKYLKFVEQGAKPNRKTNEHNVWSADGQAKLGVIKWYSHWRRYVFYPQSETLYDVMCLRGIATYISGLMAMRSLGMDTVGYKTTLSWVASEEEAKQPHDTVVGTIVVPRRKKK